MKKYIIFLILLIILPFQIFSQEDWYMDKPIIDFMFSGLESISENDIYPILRPYIGRPFTLDLYYEMQGRLYSLDFFISIEAEALEVDATKKEVIIEWVFVERPTISRIEVIGNRKETRFSIMNEIQLKRGDFVSESSLLFEESIIKEFYIAKGFPDIDVDSEIEIDEEFNLAVVTFIISEGAETKISEIIFSGNIITSDNSLKRNMETKEQSLFRSGAYQESILQQDLNNIISYYQNHGYIDADILRVDKELIENVDKERTDITLTIYIEEGEQFTFGGITYEGNLVFSEEDINELIRLETGSIFNLQKVTDTIERISNLYWDNGYIYSLVEPVLIRDDANRSVSYHLTIEESDRAHIEKITIIGNDKTRDEVILRELLFEEGDIFSLGKIQESYFALMNLQYFLNVLPQPKQGSAPGLMELDIVVEEQKTADFRLAATFTAGDFPIAGSIGWSDRNFLGTGKTIGVDLEGSAFKQGLSFRFQDSYLFNRNWGGGIQFSIFHSIYSDIKQDILSPIFFDEDIPDGWDSEEDYEDAIRSGEIMPSTSFMEYNTIDLTLGVSSIWFIRKRAGRFSISSGVSTTASYLWYEKDIYRPYMASIRENHKTWKFINSWNTTFALDKRDLIYNPSKGYYFSQLVGFTGGFLLGARDFIKLKTRADLFLTMFAIPMGDEDWKFKAVLAFHTAFSFILPQFGDNLTITPREYLGLNGMTIARGWPPSYEYKALWENSLEIRHPLMKDILWWTWLFDAAAVWPEVQNIGSMSLNDWYFSFGAGIRVNLPALPIRLYFAQAFKWEDGRLLWENGDFSLGGLGLKFVVSFSQPGGF